MILVNSARLKSSSILNSTAHSIRFFRGHRSAMLIKCSSNELNRIVMANWNSVHIFGRPSLLEDHKAPRNISKAIANLAETPVAADLNESHVSSYRVLFAQVMASNAVTLANAAVVAAEEATALSSEENALDKLLLEEQVKLDEVQDYMNTVLLKEERLLSVSDESDQSLLAESSGRSTVEVVVKSGRRSKRLQTKERVERKLAEATNSLKLPETSESDAERLIREKRKRRALTSEEEISLAKGVQDLLAIEQAKSAFIQKMHREPTVQEWAQAASIEERAFHRRLWIGRMCKDKIVRCNLGLIAMIAKNYLDYGLPMDDLMQDGCLGLLRGIEKFDPGRGCKLSTYVYWWIKQAIGRAVAAKAKPVRLPVHYYEVISRIKRVRRSLYEKYGRRADDQEVAEAAGVSVSRMHAVMNWSGVVKSFDKPVGRNGDITLQEVTPDESVESCQNTVSRLWLRDDVDKTLKHLRPREEDVMRHRYGLNGSRAKTLEEIGSMYNVTRERIRQIEIRAMRKLKTAEVNELLRLHLNSNVSL